MDRSFRIDETKAEIVEVIIRRKTKKYPQFNIIT